MTTILTAFGGYMFARSFLYLLVGILEAGRIPGQGKQQTLAHTGRTLRDMIPIVQVKATLLF